MGVSVCYVFVPFFPSFFSSLLFVTEKEFGWQFGNNGKLKLTFGTGKLPYHWGPELHRAYLTLRCLASSCLPLLHHGSALACTCRFSPPPSCPILSSLLSCPVLSRPVSSIIVSPLRPSPPRPSSPSLYQLTHPSPICPSSSCSTFWPPSHPSKTGLETRQSSVSHLIAHRPPVPCNSRSHGLP